MLPDATYKTIFAHRFMVEELMRWLVADLHGAGGLVDALDLSGMERMQEQSVTSGAGGQHGYANDIVWQVPTRHRPEAGEGWRRLVVMLEFQSTVDYAMALRIRNYVDNFHMEQWRGRRLRRRDRLAPVLPIVLYRGRPRWTAAARVIDLVTPGASSSPGGVGSGATCRASPLFVGDGYLLLDTLRLGPEDLRRDNAAALLAGLENLWRERIPAQLAALRARLDGPELAPLRGVVFRWVQHLAKQRNRLDLGMEDMAEIDRMHESGETEAYFAARLRAWQDEYRAEGRAEGRAQGIEQGLERGLSAERELLSRQARRKFGADTAQRLAGLLATVDDTDRLVQVGEWIIDCETGERLIARFGNGAG